jgi:hypothetical protein
MDASRSVVRDQQRRRHFFVTHSGGDLGFITNEAAFWQQQRETANK